mmetsp:Transcript_35477/g.92412  ORF Transcript_35477/g.92412 Transcript_35477/m.92412 type:complete len:107 (+) Transcript_35477:192-512(+)
MMARIYSSLLFLLLFFSGSSMCFFFLFLFLAMVFPLCIYIYAYLDVYMCEKCEGTNACDDCIHQLNIISSFFLHCRQSRQAVQMYPLSLFFSSFPLPLPYTIRHTS